MLISFSSIPTTEKNQNTRHLQKASRVYKLWHSHSPLEARQTGTAFLFFFFFLFDLSFFSSFFSLFFPLRALPKRTNSPMHFTLFLLLFPLFLRFFCCPVFAFSQSLLNNFFHPHCSKKKTLRGHTAKVKLLYIFGDHLLSYSEDQVLKIWHAKEGTLFDEFSFGKSFHVTTITHPDTYLNKILFGSEEGTPNEAHLFFCLFYSELWDFFWICRKSGTLEHQNERKDLHIQGMEVSSKSS
jgi:hypothetical protein